MTAIHNYWICWFITANKASIGITRETWTFIQTFNAFLSFKLLVIPAWMRFWSTLTLSFFRLFVQFLYEILHIRVRPCSFLMSFLVSLKLFLLMKRWLLSYQKFFFFNFLFIIITLGEHLKPILSNKLIIACLSIDLIFLKNVTSLVLIISLWIPIGFFLFRLYILFFLSF
jgi:hypothetical protein